MSNELMQFGFEGHDVRIHVDDSGNPWWIAVDVCKILGISNVSDAVGRLQSDEKSDARGIGKTDTALIINEKGLYRLIFRSNKAEAERFQDWVFGEVLPQIRKTGRYESTSGIAHRPTREAVGIVQDYLDLAKLCEVPKHLALIEASKATRVIGVDISGFLQQSAAMEDIKSSEVMLEPTELASVLGFKSAKSMNKMLEQLGLQSRIAGHWVATDRADGMYYKHAWQNNGKSGYNLKWNVAKVEEQLSNMLEERD